LTEVLDAIEENRDVRNFSQPHLQTVKVGGTVLDLKVSTLPTIARDLTDRNRTSPFAFTGNKFEFRAVGSKQSPSFPVVLLNAAVAGSINELTERLIAVKGDKPEPSIEDILEVVREYITKSKNIRFEGNGYSDEWVVEAESRGLPNIKSCPVAFLQLLEPANANLLHSLGVMSKDELHSRYHILMEKYAKDLLIEAETLVNMVQQGVIPASFETRKEIANFLAVEKSLGLPAANEAETFAQLTELTSTLVSETKALTEAIAEIHGLDAVAAGEAANSKLTVLLHSVRSKADAIEAIIPDKIWPYPKYSELLF